MKELGFKVNPLYRHCKTIEDVISYIEEHFDEIKAHASDVEQRMDDDYLTKELLIRDHHAYLKRCQAAGVPYLYVDQKYDIDAETAAVCMGL